MFDEHPLQGELCPHHTLVGPRQEATFVEGFRETDESLLIWVVQTNLASVREGFNLPFPAFVDLELPEDEEPDVLPELSSFDWLVEGQEHSGWRVGAGELTVEGGDEADAWKRGFVLSPDDDSSGAEALDELAGQLLVGPLTLDIAELRSSPELFATVPAVATLELIENVLRNLSWTLFSYQLCIELGKPPDSIVGHR